MADRIHRQVTIGGWVRRPLSLDARQLAERADARRLDFTVVCTFDGQHGGTRAMIGVPLVALIGEAEPAFEQRTDFKRVAVIAESGEGYRALFSWGELFNTAVGDGVMLAWPEGSPQGPCVVLSLADRATGPRYVKDLHEVSLVQLW